MKRGDRVRIRKGAQIYSLYPGWPKEGKPAGRTFAVTLHFTEKGYSGAGRDGEVVVEPRVEWAGRGGYWTWTHPDNAEAEREASES